jgi:UDPglucose 6-dehydrogenase
VRVTVIGAGYVGVTSAAVLAYLGHNVTCVEREAARLDCLHRGKDPLGEPGLAELLGRRDIRFVQDAGDIGSADVIVVAVGTPMGADGRPDLGPLDDATAEISALASEGAVVLIRSTVPVGTCDRLQNGPLKRLWVVSNPEFLREGQALHDAFFPDRIVAGGPPEARQLVAELYRKVLGGEGLPGSNGSRRTVPFLWMSARSAELAKYAANGFLATRLSFVNEIAHLAELVGADASAVLDSMRLDPRIGAAYLRPGLGWGGSCLPKDARALRAIAEGEGYDFVVLAAAIEQNARHVRGFARSIARAVPKRGKVGLLGLAFKAGTPDTRESPAIRLARRLIRGGIRVSAYDPAVSELPDEPDVLVRSTVLEACESADAVVIGTEWPEFAEIDLGALRQVTRGDLLFDGRNLVSPMTATAAGFRYRGVAGIGD